LVRKFLRAYERDLAMKFLGTASGYTPTTSGIANLRIHRIRFDWENTSAIAAWKSLFLVEHADHVHVWSCRALLRPEIYGRTRLHRVEQRFGVREPFKLEAGLLDPSATSTHHDE